MHLAVLAARDDVRAVVHTHSPHATALSLVGDSVPVAKAAPSGTAEFGEAALSAAARSTPKQTGAKETP
jgi:ribulose-5-phosphate 4-epimerase/fuculose-1-phosphate aldolase